jgi:hypothetical protein
LASTRGAGIGGGGGGGAKRSRDLINAKANGGGAAKAGRAVRYLEKRKEKDRDLDKEKWRTLEPELGEKEQFKEAVRKREDKGREVSYMSLVISPERTDLEITPQELARMAEPWTRNQNGREVEHVGYVHDDTEHPHLHLLVARHYYTKREMEQNKEATRGMIREIERERGLERIPERTREPERGREQEPTREREKEPGRDYGLEQ